MYALFTHFFASVFAVVVFTVLTLFLSLPGAGKRGFPPSLGRAGECGGVVRYRGCRSCTTTGKITSVSLTGADVGLLRGEEGGRG